MTRDYTEHSHRLFILRRMRGRNRLALCVAITAAAMVVEFIAGLLTGSLALISDAGHMLTHGFSLLISYFASFIAQKPATSRRTFGLYRAEILAALFNGASLLVITGFIAWYAVQRIFNPVPIAAGWMLLVAVAGLMVNIATALILRGSISGDLNIRSAFVHMLGDMFSSIIVVAGAIAIIWTGWRPIDPILSILVCVLILVWAYRLIKESVEILLQAAPRDVDIPAIAERLSRVDGVRLVHDVHVWSITSGLHSLTAHVRINDMPVSRSRSILNEIGEILKHDFHVMHYTIQFECGECIEHPMNH
jgi:cobalt-zinc-cadmium efflux system protein